MNMSGLEADKGVSSSCILPMLVPEEIGVNSDMKYGRPNCCLSERALVDFGVAEWTGSGLWRLMAARKRINHLALKGSRRQAR